MKRRLLKLVGTSAFGQFLSVMERLDRTPIHLLRVLTYHRVDEPDANPYLSPSLLSATPGEFEEQMRFISTRYQPISLDQLLAFYEDGVALPKRAVLVTFDDATIDFEKHAWPALKFHRIPATVFVPTGFPDHPERSLWWNQLYNAVKRSSKPAIDSLPLQTDAQRTAAFKNLREHAKTLPHSRMLPWVDEVCAKLEVPPLEHNGILGWEQIRKLAADGVTLGAHTRTHPLMNRVSPEEAIDEAVGSLRDLEEKVGVTLPTLAYPAGGFTRDLALRLGEAGFKLAFTTNRGINDLRSADPLRLRRINVGGNTSVGVMRSQLLSLMVNLNRLQRNSEGT